MRKEIRRVIMFCTILTVGILLLTFDITFIQLLLLVLAIALIMPFLLGLVTIAELREAFASFKENTLKKVTLLKKLDDIKLFEKKAPVKSPAPPAKAVAPAKPAPATDKNESKIPFSSHIQSLISSLGSLGSVLKERTKRERKVLDINTMLDKTVKGEVPPPAVTPAAEGSSLPAPPGGAGPAVPDEEDPFLSLSGDEFDDGLLDGLDDDGTSGLPGTMEPPSGDGLPAAGMELPEPELSMPGSGGAPDESAELDAAASAILAAAGETDEGLDDFSGLESPEGTGADAELGDLDNISLDEIDIDADLEEEGETGGGAEPAEAAPAARPRQGRRPPLLPISPGQLKLRGSPRMPLAMQISCRTRSAPSRTWQHLQAARGERTRIFSVRSRRMSRQPSRKKT